MVLGAAASRAQSLPAGAIAPAAVNDRLLPIELQAESVQGRPDIELEAKGRVELRRGRLTLFTDRLQYDNVLDRAHATGGVRINTNSGDRFSGPELLLTLDRFEGYFLQPEYWFTRTGAGGRAERIDFLDSQRSVITRADYTSCRRDGTGTPAWLLTSDRVRFDFEANEGIAEGAVLRFMGVPILAAPTLSFPLTDARKSGWLPPSINLDSRSGFEFGAPYYWNIAPQRDATIAPVLYTKRGLGVDLEARYLEQSHGGEARLHWLPKDQVFGDARRLVQWRQSGSAFGNAGSGWRWSHEGLRVSDDSYWKDFSGTLRNMTPRLLPLAAAAERDLALAPWLQGTLYARAQLWQTLQDADPTALIRVPYNRAPQLGWRGAGQPWADGPAVGVELEYNRFVRANNDAPGLRNDGSRVHLLAQASQTWRPPGAWLTPRLALNLAQYRTELPMSDGRRSAVRAIPTLSVEGGLVFERSADWFGRALTQTLEPRLLYVNTPYRAQSMLPLFDSAAKDFNFDSVFSDNAFSGIDRVSDAHQFTAGLATRWLEPVNGSEVLRLGLAQRYLLRDQQVTPDGIPNTQRLSDLLLVGSARLTQRWSFDAALQYGAENDRVNRSVLGARYSGGPFRVVSANYRFTRGSSEQLDVGWQWPLYRREGVAAAGSACAGNLYGVGRVSYSMRDSRITDSLAGLEYDTGCWIGRAVAERISTGRAAATTRLMLQLELVGLSRLGSNPLAVLKDNIPGYTLLRDERSDPPLRTYLNEAAPAGAPANPAR